MKDKDGKRREIRESIKVHFTINIVLIFVGLIIGYIYFSIDKPFDWSFLFIILNLVIIGIGMTIGMIGGFASGIATLLLYGAYILYMIFDGMDIGKIYYVNGILIAVSTAIASLGGKVINGALVQSKRCVEKCCVHEVTNQITQQYNLKGFYKHLVEESFRAKRYNSSFSVIMIRIKYFDQLKKIFGSKISEDVTLKVSIDINDLLRVSDRKYTLEENLFAAITPYTGGEGLEIVRSRLKEKLEKTNLVLEKMQKDSTFNLDVEVAMIEYDEKIENPMEYYEKLLSDLEYDTK